MASIEETQGLLGGNKALPSSSITLDKSDADAGVWLVRAVSVPTLRLIFPRQSITTNILTQAYDSNEPIFSICVLLF